MSERKDDVMSDDAQDEPTKPAGDEARHDPVEALIRASGRRPAVPDHRARRVRGTVHAAWRAEVDARRRRGRVPLAALATAAVVALAALAGLLWRGSGEAPVPAPVLARVQILSGETWWAPDAARAGARSPLSLGDDLRAGGEVTTAAGGRAALRLASGHSLRLDGGTRIRLLEGGAVSLDGGAVYVDSRDPSGRPAQGALDLSTPRGVLRETGTQFEARLLAGGALRIRVREGAVALSEAGPPLRVGAGQELTVATDGQHRLESIPVHGDAWAWLDLVTPMPELQDLSLHQFLEWMARERGLSLAYEPADLADTAAATGLKGSVQGMTPEEALESVLATSGLRHRREDGGLVVYP